MSANSFSNNTDLISREDLQAVRQMVGQTAKFIALYEQAAQKIERHEIASGQRLAESEEYFRNRLEDVNYSINEMRSMMTEVGVARFSVLAEESLRSGQAHVDTLKTLGSALQLQLADSVKNLEVSIKKASDELMKAAKSVRLEELKALTEESSKRITETTDRAVRRLTGTLSWLHWERISVIFIIALVVALVTGLLGGGFSFESKKAIQTERSAGQAILRAWPQLSEIDKEKIKSAMKLM